jgi:nitrate/nitrite transporter NarK
MGTLFDYVTVACFLGVAGAFFMVTLREPRTLLHILLAGIAFAIANQLGNAGYAVFGWIMIIAGIVYAVLVIRQR